MAEMKESETKVANIIKERTEAKSTKVEIKASKQSITPTAGALEAFSADEKDLLSRIAEKVTELVQLEEIRLAHERCEMLENDEKVALWSLLDSRTRSALKKYKTAITSASQK